LFPWVTLEETYVDANDNDRRKVKLDVGYRAQFDEVAPTVRDLLVKCIGAAEREVVVAEAKAKMGDHVDK
jgi:ribosomal protein S24E